MYEIGLLASLIMNTPDADSINAEAARSRDSIVVGDLQYEIAYGKGTRDSLDVEWQSPIFKDRIVYDRHSEFYAYLDRWTPEEATFLRNDGEPLIRRHESGGSYQRIVVRPDRMFEYFPDPLSDGSHLAILEHRIDDKPVQLAQVFLPWNFGVIPDLVDRQDFRTFDAVIKSASENVPSVSEDVVDGNKCWRIEYHTHDGRTVKVWHDPAKGMNVFRVVMEGANEHWAWRNTLNSSLSRFDDGPVWFPSEVIFRSETTGASDPDVLILQKIKVVTGRFNFKLAPDQFSVKTLEPAPHTDILRQFGSSESTEEWNGEKVDLRKSHARIEGPTALSRPRRSLRTKLLVAGNVFLAALALVWYRSHKAPLASK